MEGPRRWGICRVEVPPGSSLLIRSKGPFPFCGSAQAAEGTLVRTDRSGRPTRIGILGEATVKKTELTRQAEADRFRQYVKALGGPDAYNRCVFAVGLPDTLKLGVFYAGPGTLWTNLKGFEQTMLGKLAAEGTAPKPPTGR